MANALIPTRRNFMQGACAASALAVVPLDEAGARERVEQCYRQLAVAMTNLTSEKGGNAWSFECLGMEDSVQAPDQQTQSFTIWADQEKLVLGKATMVPVQIGYHRYFNHRQYVFDSDSLTKT